MKNRMFRFVLPALAALIMLSPGAVARASDGTPDAGATALALTGHYATMPGYDRYSSPVVADIDGDGLPEILVGTEAGMLVAMKYRNGALQTLWQTSLGASLGSSPAVGDMDGDGQPEIVIGVGWSPVSQRGRIMILNRNGSTRCERGTQDRNGGPDGVPDGVFSTPALGDVDGDGKLEAVAAGYDEELYVIKSDCSDLAVPGSTYGWPRFLQDNTWSSPALADINHDGRPEIVVGSYYHQPPFCPDSGCGTLWVFDYKGNALPGWPVRLYTHLDSSPAVADIDRDGQYEIVVGTGQNNDSRFYKVYAFRSDGGTEPGWPQATVGWVWSSPAIADVDGDGYPEIFAASADVDAGKGKLYGWRYNGQSLPNWPVQPINQNGEPQGVATASSPTIVDADNDGQPEIFITSGWDVVGYKVNSVPLSAYRMKTTYSLGSTPAWGDLNGDGLLEMAIGGGNYNEVPNGTGRLYVWDIGTAYRADRTPWPMWRRNAQRTGLVQALATLKASPSPLMALQQAGSGSATYSSLSISSQDGTPLDWQARATDSRVTLAAASGRTPAGGVSSVKVTINTGGLSNGWHDLGTINVTASTPTGPATNSPTQIPVRVFVGKLSRVFLPVTRR